METEIERGSGAGMDSAKGNATLNRCDKCAEVASAYR